MTKIGTDVPMQTLNLSPVRRSRDSLGPKLHSTRSQSMPILHSANPRPFRKVASQAMLRGIDDTSRSGAICREKRSTEDKPNAFLRDAGFHMALRDGRIITMRHRDSEAMEAQRPPAVKDLIEIHKALLVAEETPERRDLEKALIPAIHRQLTELAEAKEPTTLVDWMKVFGKSYFERLGGRDLAIDDTIGAINASFFERIGEDRTLGISNILACGLTATLMLLPTLGKSLPTLQEGIREKDALKIAEALAEVAPILTMTLVPAAGAFGKDRLEAILAVTANILMMLTGGWENLNGGRQCFDLKRTQYDAETHPFTYYAQHQALFTTVWHVLLGSVNKVAAQAGLSVLNGMNAAAAGHSTGNPAAAFSLTAPLQISAILDMATGRQPFADYRPDPKALAEQLSTGGNDNDPSHRVRQLVLQQKIAENGQAADYASLLHPHLKQSPWAHIIRQIGGKAFSDAEEKTFLKGLMSMFCPNKKAEVDAHVAIDRIYRFEKFDPAKYGSGDQHLGEVLRAVQEERNKDKGFCRMARGHAHANNVYNNIIAYAIQCVSFKELNGLEGAGVVRPRV